MNGEYRLVVDGYDEATGPYQFRLLNKSQAVIVPIGSAISGTFDSNTTSQSYQFELTSNRKILIDGISGNGQWLLYNPSGYYLSQNGLTSDTTLDLPMGSYWLILDPSSSGTLGYQMQLLDQGVGNLIAATGIPLPINTIISDTISQVGQRKSYILNGMAGQQIFFDGLSGSNIIARVYDPSGREIIASDTSYDSYYSGLVLKNTGNY